MKMTIAQVMIFLSMISSAVVGCVSPLAYFSPA
jgi:hypothetical protein